LNQSRPSSDMHKIKDSSFMYRYESICSAAQWAMMCCSGCSRAGDLHRAVMAGGGL